MPLNVPFSPPSAPKQPPIPIITPNRPSFFSSPPKPPQFPFQSPSESPSNDPQPPLHPQTPPVSFLIPFRVPPNDPQPPLHPKPLQFSLQSPSESPSAPQIPPFPSHDPFFPPKAPRYPPHPPQPTPLPPPFVTPLPPMSLQPTLGAITPSGSHLLQLLLRFRDPSAVLGGLKALSDPHLHSLALSPPGSHVWDVILGSPSVPPRTRRRLIRRLKVRGHFWGKISHFRVLFRDSPFWGVGGGGGVGGASMKPRPLHKPHPRMGVEPR